MEPVRQKSVSRHFAALVILSMVGCAGMERGCASCTAQSFGADWVVVQMDLSGKPFRCWELRNVSISNEPQSDGIYWKDTTTDNLVHISGLYNRVQVERGNWDKAYTDIGLTKEACAFIRERTYDPADGQFKPLKDVSGQ